MILLAAMLAMLTAVSSTTFFATELDAVLDESREAEYAAEQIITCSTPDGVRDAVVRITQTQGELRVSSSVTDDVEVYAGSGYWTLTREEDVVAGATVDSGKVKTEPLYTVEEVSRLEYLGRDATSYRLIREGELRAEVVADDATGALIRVVTFTADGEVYCERRFVSFDPEVEESTSGGPATSEAAPALVEESTLPVELAGFERLDQYEAEDGVRFAYYSDGFFSFGVFETPTVVALDEASMVELGSGVYRRVFTAGQATYVWETRNGGFALIGDLPPDLHEEVLSALPLPEDPGFFRRWWRNLFG